MFSIESCVCLEGVPAFLWRGSTVPAILSHHGCSLVALQEIIFFTFWRIWVTSTFILQREWHRNSRWTWHTWINPSLSSHLWGLQAFWAEWGKIGKEQALTALIVIVLSLKNSYTCHHVRSAFIKEGTACTVGKSFKTVSNEAQSKKSKEDSFSFWSLIMINAWHGYHHSN